MELNSQQKRQKILYEIKDLLTGSAFPLMLQLVLSASVIMFSGYVGDKAVQILILIVGELMLSAAYFIFGRQNGVSAYRKTVITSKKRELETNDVKAYYGTGEYAVWKGAAIGLISVVPFALVQFIECLAPNAVCDFILRYAFGWASCPFAVIGGNLSKWLDFIWIVLPVGVHTGAYVFGAFKEAKRQKILEDAQDIKDRKKK